MDTRCWFILTCIELGANSMPCMPGLGFFAALGTSVCVAVSVSLALFCATGSIPRSSSLAFPQKAGAIFCSVVSTLAEVDKFAEPCFADYWSAGDLNAWSWVPIALSYSSALILAFFN